MSNPAVIKLQSGKIGNSKVWLDDNFGESIHIHIDDYRVDLTVAEFHKMYLDLCLSVNELLCVEGFNIEKIDPVFFAVSLWSRLPYLTKVSYDKVNLGEMLAPVNSRIVPLSESIGVQALEGVSHRNNRIDRKSHHIGQDDDERLYSIMKSIKENGYPFHENYIIMYGDDNIIRDGQHRASCLYHLFGNIDVPVMRLHFNNYTSPKIGKHYNSVINVYYRQKIKKSIFSVANKGKKVACTVKKRFNSKGIASKKDFAIDADLADKFAAK